MSEKIKVLLVPDFVHWVTGTIARNICLHNPQLDGVICSSL
jgi:hypothetical protein